MTPVRRLLLLVSVLVAAGCGGTPTVNTDPDSGVPDGSVDECEGVANCDDPLADECGLDCPSPVSLCNLGDPNRFIPNGCGFNDRGELEQKCVFSLEYNDYVWDDVECVDPDECEDGNVDNVECGINGLMSRLCNDGQWGEFDECDDVFFAGEVFRVESFTSEGTPLEDSFSGPTNAISVSFWVAGDFFSKVGLTNISEHLIWTQHGIRVNCDNNAVLKTCAATYSGGLWYPLMEHSSKDGYYHMVVTLDADHFRAYIDGAIIIDESGGNIFESETYNISIGRVATHYKHVAVFDRALSADEVLDLYNYGF